MISSGGIFFVSLFKGFLYGHPGRLWYLSFCADPHFCGRGVFGQFVFALTPPPLVPAAFPLGSGYFL